MKERDKKKRRRRGEEDEIEVISLELETPKRQKRDIKRENREFGRVTYFFVGLFLVMMGYVVYFNLFQSKNIINSPYNVRLDSMADRVVRGEILDNAGNVLAKTEVDEEGNETRVYPYGNLYAHVVGYDAHGKSGIESAENFNLLTSSAFLPEQILNELQEKKNTGDNVITTLDTAVQKSAYDALGKQKGAVIVMEATTGKILAIVSKPDFDPNIVQTEWQQLSNSEESVLLNRATQGLYAPGSVFKIVTTLAYMRENANYSSYSYLCESEMEHDGTVIHCAKQREHGTESLMTSFANSCNTSYSNIGLSLNFEKYKKTANDLLFDKKLPSVLPYSKSKFQLQNDSASYEVMMTAIGQGKTQVTPYHMALVTAAIANGGILMKPYLVSEVVSVSGKSVDKRMPEKYAVLMNSKEASQLKLFMQDVVDNGTASALKNDVYTIAGKTGTAEFSSDKEKTHSWFVGFTNIDNPDIVISVVVEDASNSGVSAVSVANKVLDSYYQ